MIYYNASVSEYQSSVPTSFKSRRSIFKINRSIYDRQSTKYHNENPINQKKCNKVDEVFVVSFTNTSSYPHTMMIKSHHAIIANITMCSSLRPPYHASFTKFHSINHVFIEVQIENSLFLMINITILHVNSHHCFSIIVLKIYTEFHYFRWNNTRIYNWCQNHKDKN